MKIAEAAYSQTRLHLACGVIKIAPSEINVRICQHLE